MLDQTTLEPKVVQTKTRAGNLETFYYDNVTVRNFAYATIIWGVVGMLAGLWAALQLVFPTVLNLGPWLNFGRLRPL
ncbi:MAG: cytochrome C oxidase Cbb3, partial [Chitinophagaceae bacterium]